VGGNLNRILSNREWILTNGLGGYALGFGDLINKRKYNGLLISSDAKFRRNHLVSSIEEKVTSGEASFFLDATHYSNCVYPNGNNHILKSWLRPHLSVFYSALPPDPKVLILKDVMMPIGVNAVIVRYSNMGSSDLFLTLRPKLSLRDHHFINSPGSLSNTGFIKNYSENRVEIRREDNGIGVNVFWSDGEVVDEHIIYGSVYYPTEAARGYDSVEDLVSPFRLEISLKRGEERYIIFSADEVVDPKKLYKDAVQRYEKMPISEDHPRKVKSSSVSRFKHEGLEFSHADYLKLLDAICRDFIVGERDVIAGYPWFGPWGRDTLISMEGFGRLKGGNELARKILLSYCDGISGAMIPNTFGEGGEGLNYDTVDAPLWFVLRAYQFASKEEVVFQKAVQIVLNFIYDTSLPFFMDTDGLVEIRQGPYAMTWMDAKVYGNPVTPRNGKPVEINALWYNALCSLIEMMKSRSMKSVSCDGYSADEEVLVLLKDKIAASMQGFVCGDYLADRLECGAQISEIRPNAMIALGLPFDFVSKDVIKSAWKVAGRELLTAYGLRSLSPEHPSFKGKYIGNQKQRDLVYHQGTVWTFPLVYFAKAAVKANDGDMSGEDLCRELSSYVWHLRRGIMKGEFSSVAEVWDGLDPYFPKGCPAQAWSAFALLEIEGIMQDLECSK